MLMAEKNAKNAHAEAKSAHFRAAMRGPIDGALIGLIVLAVLALSWYGKELVR